MGCKYTGVDVGDFNFNSKFNSIQSLLLLYSVQSEINFMDRYTYRECYDLQLIMMNMIY